MNIKEYLAIMDERFYERIKVACKDGTSFKGFPQDYTSAADNEPEGESVTIMTADNTQIEIFTEDIAAIHFI